MRANRPVTVLKTRQLPWIALCVMPALGYYQLPYEANIHIQIMVIIAIFYFIFFFWTKKSAITVCLLCHVFFSGYIDWQEKCLIKHPHVWGSTNIHPLRPGEANLLPTNHVRYVFYSCNIN